HVGIGRFSLHAGDRDRAADHLRKASRLFNAMDISLWLRQAASSLRELGVTEEGGTAGRVGRLPRTPPRTPWGLPWGRGRRGGVWVPSHGRPRGSAGLQAPQRRRRPRRRANQIPR